MNTGCRQILGCGLIVSTMDLSLERRKCHGRNRAAVWAGSLNHRLEVGCVLLEHGKSELYPLIKSWAHTVPWEKLELHMQRGHHLPYKTTVACGYSANQMGLTLNVHHPNTMLGGILSSPPTLQPSQPCTHSTTAPVPQLLASGSLLPLISNSAAAKLRCSISQV